MSGEIRITTPAVFDRWISGLGSLEVEAGDAVQFVMAGEFMFSETQRMAHVITGFMRGEGRLEPLEVSGEGIGLAIVYSAPYTGYELARGGTHDFLSMAEETARAVFEESLVDVATEAVLRATR